MTRTLSVRDRSWPCGSTRSCRTFCPKHLSPRSCASRPSRTWPPPLPDATGRAQLQRVEPQHPFLPHRRPASLGTAGLGIDWCEQYTRSFRRHHVLQFWAGDCARRAICRPSRTPAVSTASWTSTIVEFDHAKEMDSDTGRAGILPPT